MLIHELLSINEGFNTGKPGRESRDYRGKIQYRHYLSPKPGKDISDEVRELVRRYVKTGDRGQYLPQYDDDFYHRQQINFSSILNRIRQYYDIQSGK